MLPQKFIDWVESSGLGDGCLELSAHDDEVVIEGFLVPLDQRRSGVGTAILTALCRKADDDGIILAVSPEPVRIMISDPIPRKVLEAFYAKHGFIPGADGVWRRYPPGFS